MTHIHHARSTHRSGTTLALAFALTSLALAACDGPATDELDQARMLELGDDLGAGASTTFEGTSTTSPISATDPTFDPLPDLGGGGSEGGGGGSEGGGSTGGGSTGGGSEGGASTSGGSEGGSEGGGSTGGGSTGGGSEGGGSEGGGSESGGTCPVPDTGYVKPANYPAGYPEGWLDKIHFETCTQCGFQNWVDSDGVDPETPGCHQAYERLEIDPAVVAVGGGGVGVLLPVCSVPTNDRFGEGCDGDVLLETNPGKDVCHAHPIGENGVGVGHPDRFSCAAFCERTYGLPGTCQVAYDYCGNGVDSAYCMCGC